jgi:protein involved in sex pheromone biosynthesis
MNLNELLTEYQSDAEMASFATSLKEYYKNYDGASGAKSFNDELLKKMMDELTTIRTKMLS